MADIVNNLFGIDPAALQQQRALTDQEAALKYAGLDDLSRARYGIALGARGIGRGVNQLLGGDEQLNTATKVRELASQFDMSNPGEVMAFAKAVAPFAPDVAQVAIKRSNDMTTSLLQQRKIIAETDAKLREKTLPTSGLGKLITEKEALLASGVPANDPRVVAYDNAIKAEGEGKAPKVAIDLGGVFDKAFSKQEGEKQADDWAKAGQAYSDASALARNVREMESVVGTAFVGSYGSLQAGVSRAFGGGKRLNDTEVFDALSAQLVLPLAKLLPGSLAVKELDQLIKTKPNLKQQEGTIRRLLNTINQDLRASEISYEAGEKYRAANNGKISGFNPYIAKNKATRLTELEAKFKTNNKLSDSERAEAKKLAQELQLEGL
jgi:hypothetical protein